MSILKRVNICTLFIALMCVYNLQWLAPQLKSISQFVQFSYLLIAFYCYIYCITNYQINRLMKAFNLLVIMFSVYGVIHIFLEKQVIISGSHTSVPSYVYLQRILRSILPIFAFYYFSKKGFITQRFLHYLFFVFFVTAILEFNAAYIRKIGEEMNGEVTMTNNMGYVVLALMPCLCLYNKKPIIKYIGLAIIMTFVFLSAKRGTILIMILGSFILLYKDMKLATNKHRVRILIVAVALILGMYKVVIYLLRNSFVFLNKITMIEENNSSGRDVLYSYFWNAFSNDASFLQMLFGRGANGTIKIYYNYAHNDWLEILTNQGLLGIIIFLYYWICFYKDWSSIPKQSDISLSLGLILLIYFSKSLFSMSYASMSLYSTILIGYYCANNYFAENDYTLPKA